MIFLLCHISMICGHSRISLPDPRATKKTYPVQSRAPLLPPWRGDRERERTRKEGQVGDLEGTKEKRPWVVRCWLVNESSWPSAIYAGCHFAIRASSVSASCYTVTKRI